jgi:DUF4097 and DUF4098 domain-containing protein YvlB
MLLILATVASLGLAQQTDTTVTVRQGQRLDFGNFSGSIVIKTWRQNSVRVRASHSRMARIEVSTEGPTVSIDSRGRHGPTSVDYDIVVPVWMPIAVQGSPSSDVTIEGTEAEVSVETVEGAVHVVGGTGNITLHSVDGDVSLEGAKGHIELNSVDGGIEIRNCSGDVQAETVDGNVTMLGIESADVDANTVDGTIEYDGSIKDGGRYRLTTHSGDVTVSIPEKASATVTVSTFSGSIDASFPLTLMGTTPNRHRFSFTLGSGSARVELESFDGTIRLRRPGDIRHDEDN